MTRAILSARHVGDPPWPTVDPFLFCVHHVDDYPEGNEQMGPNASLAGRRIGMDFAGKDGWRMYHGDEVPGFPRHPHRGFETITIVRRGHIDHSDSLGATARFGPGDVQWMTAGKGIVHCEMFPLRQREARNPAELFQIWLNLPKADKMVDPYFTMLWNEAIPQRTFRDHEGHVITVRVIAGTLGDAQGPPPPPNSWASRPESGLAIWTIVLEPGARWRLPLANAELGRSLYTFEGTGRIEQLEVDGPMLVQVAPDQPVELQAGPQGMEILMLQARPIGEPVAHHGPFVMNTQGELKQAFLDYRSTGFGGWPWPSDAPVHPREEGRFAIHAGGRRETPTV